MGVGGAIRVFFLSLFSSVLGTYLFTQALFVGYGTGDFITPLLVQKLQPLFVTVLSVVFLGERISRTFILLATTALIGSYLTSFGLRAPSLSSLETQASIYALAAAASWGIGTILSKQQLTHATIGFSTWIRFMVAIPIAGLFVVVGNTPLHGLTSDAILRFFLIACTTGAGALLLYYRGLKRIPAHVATIAELAFPLMSVFIGMSPLNPYGAPQPVSLAQASGMVMLLCSMLLLARHQRRQGWIVGVVVHGSKDGTAIGFPTLNISYLKKPTIPFGVYGCRVLIGSSWHNGILHYGPRAVFGETKALFEVHVFEFNQNVYGETVQVDIGSFIRPTYYFDSITALKKQIKQDIAEARGQMEKPRD
jgi:drug/metabolite transporter (DMT)-like permease